MNISDLPPGLKELAELRRAEHAKRCKVKEVRTELRKAFSWGHSPERWKFWLEVNDENFSVYYNCKVVNCKPKVQNLKHEF